jgi:glycosyltransferase involved in cell wall biosynthesis
MLRAVVTPGATAILVSTSPPFAGFGGCVFSVLRRLPLVWWVMDVNPDQMVRSGRLSTRSLLARAFDWMNRRTLARARDVIVLDRFMRDRILEKAPVSRKLHVVPPWPHDNVLADVPHAANPFRGRHGLADSFVVMYSGNHGYSTPLGTLLEAAARLRHESRLKFVFIGGGVVKRDIDAMVARDRPPNIVSLPYQPLADIRYSLSAADVHVVSIADEAVGVVHPCKVYGALAIGRPVIALAPAASYVADILDRDRVGWLVEHGDVDRLVALLVELLATPAAELAAMGQAAKEAVRTCYSRDLLLGRVCDIVAGVAASGCGAGAEAGRTAAGAASS